MIEKGSITYYCPFRISGYIETDYGEKSEFPEQEF